jgi:hypothetical protein
MERGSGRGLAPTRGLITLHITMVYYIYGAGFYTQTHGLVIYYITIVYIRELRCNGARGYITYDPYAIRSLRREF